MKSMEPAEVATKRADAVTNRARIIEVALSIFAECGLELEMNEIAARAHLGVGTLYRHFDNREDLLRAIIRRAVEDALMQMRSAVSASDDPVASLQALVSAGLHMQQQYRPLFAVIRDPRLAKLLDPSYAQSIRTQFRETVEKMIDHGLEIGVFRGNLDQEMAAVAIMGSFACAIDLLDTNYSFDELAQRLSYFLFTMLTGKTET
jgi:AcrR family transcriptional regulator